MRAAVIGCGRMGAEPSSRMAGKVPAGWLPISHLEALQLVPGIESIALCEVNEALLKQRGDQHNIEELYTDYQELIDTFKPDIVTIATRTPAKAAIIDYACRAGVKGLYIEKPFANSLSELEQGLDLIKTHHVKLSYGVNRRFHPVYRTAKAMINEGEIGEVVHIVAEHGLSQLLWTHPHSVDLFLYFLNSFGQIKVQACATTDSMVLADKWTVDSDPVIEGAFFKFDSGVTANIAKANGLNLRICGTKGNLTVHANGTYLQLNRGGLQNPGLFLEQKINNSIPSHSATVTALTELVNAVEQNAPSSISLEEIEWGMKMLFGCAWSSANESQLINIAELPSQLVVTGKFGDFFA